MKPLKLQVTGFTCFRETQFLDFTDLELFAIQGPTGAGKSSILDAMTYALYGETPRLGAQGLAALVSQGASQMQVMFEFEIAGSGRYRVTRVWSVKATEKQTRLERAQNGGWESAIEGVSIAAVNSAIRNLIGLDFDGFTRAILLPQGRFDEFLRGDKAKRRDLLKSLLNLQHIENMRALANSRATVLTGEFNQISSVLATEYSDATEARRDELSTTLAAAETGLAATDEVVKRSRASVNLLSDLREKTDAVAGAAADLERRLAEGEATRLDEGRLEAALRAAAVAPHSRAALTAATALQVAEHGARGAHTQLEAALSDFDVSQSAAVSAQQAAAELSPKLEQGLAEVERSEGSLRLLQVYGGDLSLAASAEAALDGELLQALAALEPDLAAFKEAGQHKATAARELDAQQKIVTLGGRALNRLGAQVDVSLAEGMELKSQFEEARARLNEALHHDRVTALLQGLQVDDPCPVCGEPLRSLPPALGGADLARLTVGAKQAEDALLKKRGEHSELTGRRKAEENNLVRENEKLKARQRALDSAALALKEALEPIAAVLGDVADPVAEAELLKRGQLAALAAEIVAVTGGLTPQAARQKLRRQLLELERAVNEANERVSAAQGRIGGLRLAHENAWETRRQREQERDDAAKALAQALAEQSFTSSEDAQGAFLPAPEVASLRQQLEAGRERLREAQARKLAADTALAGRLFDPLVLADQEAALAEAELGKQRLTIELGALRTQLEALAGKLGRAAELAARLKVARREAEVYARLAADLKGNEFQEYLLSKMQDELVGAASQVLADITEGRYRFEIELGEYKVIDAFNGGQSRGVNTLSGGESFMASLSLALALSQALAGSKSLGALFLDEGFGTLDEEALDSVAQVLEALQTQGRMVGVITHVPSLAERLPHRITVEKHGNSSRILVGD